ncbi:hypothetical protein SAMN05216266_101471 [Amycolatopsis marina]|uniref:Uncharacterized protein n=1 Tax=Amycolatopsis marina TaxID=490629 RepID=A0A1I0VT97_9PSEU|nr:hypothetical protein [Amycolatopsis marina]SFA79448.1 hypothetical protein SAMN05216266_101471 [Amycolatopsis marina]
MSISSEMDKGTPIHRSRVHTSYISKVVMSLLAVAFGVFGIIVAIVDENAPWWVAIVGVIIAAVLFGVGMVLTQVTVVVQPGALYVSAGYRTVKLPISSIGYFGQVRLTRRNALRFSKFGNLTNGKPGPAVEVVTRDGKYYAILTNSGTELADVLLREGLDPSALRVAFPVDVVGSRADYDREQRPASMPGNQQRR